MIEELSRINTIVVIILFFIQNVSQNSSDLRFTQNVYIGLLLTKIYIQSSEIIENSLRNQP